MKRISAALSLLILSGCAPKVIDYEYNRNINAEADMLRLYSCKADLFVKPLSLNDAIEIALANNLDIRLQNLEQMIQNERTTGQTLRMLPSFGLNGEWSHRDKNTAYSSRNIVTGITGDPAESSTQTTDRFDATMLLNVLDFGISYYKSRQETNKTQLMKQKHLRARQNLVLDVYRAYFRAAVANRARDKSHQLITLLEQREESLSRQQERRVIPEMQELLARDRLVDMKIKLSAFENEYRSAMTELMSLMGSPPGCNVQLLEPELKEIKFDDLPICDLEVEALRYRPELMGQDIQSAIDADEVRANILRMFPNANLFYGYYNDQNPFLLFNDWKTIGLRASYDLFSLPAKYSDLTASRYQRFLTRQMRLSMSMGVLTQVHLSYINVQESIKQYALAHEYSDVKRKILTLSEKQLKSGRINPTFVLDQEVEMLFAEVNAFRAYGNVQIALEQLGNAIGRPLAFTGETINCCARPLEQCKTYPFVPTCPNLCVCTSCCSDTCETEGTCFDVEEKEEWEDALLYHPLSRHPDPVKVVSTFFQPNAMVGVNQPNEEFVGLKSDP